MTPTTRLAVAVALLLALPCQAHAQVITLTVGPADAHDATGADRPLGVAGAVGFERTRQTPGLTWRAEFAVTSVASPQAFEEVEGPLRHFGLFAHGLYVVPGTSIAPHVGVGVGPVLRAVGSPSNEEARLGGAAMISAGLRAGDGWRRVLLEARTGVTVAGIVARGARVQRWSQLVIGGSFDFSAT